MRDPGIRPQEHLVRPVAGLAILMNVLCSLIDVFHLHVPDVMECGEFPVCLVAICVSSLGIL